MQHDVDPRALMPTRAELSRGRYEFQRRLIESGEARFTPIFVNRLGIIIDGHHAVRAAAALGRRVSVAVSALEAKPSAGSIMDLPLE